jgi:NitT/TauT family transport system substrate-binding protein
VAGAFAALGGLAAAGVRAQETTRLRFQLDWRIEGPSAIVLLTQAKGYFAEEKLDVVIDAGSGSSAAVQRLAAGTHDIGFADIASLIELHANNPQAPRLQAVYLLLERTPAALFARRSSGIRTPADLVGRKLAAPVFDAGRKTFPLFAKANRLPATPANWVNVDPALRETLLARGEVDAITGFYYTSLLNLEARGLKEGDLTVFKYAEHGVQLYGNAVVASPKLIAEKPQALAAFLRALNRGIKDTVRDPRAAMRYVKEREGTVDLALEERRLRYFLDHFLATPLVRSQGLGGVDTARLRLNTVQVVDAFGLKQYPDADLLFNPAFLPALSERRL